MEVRYVENIFDPLYSLVAVDVKKINITMAWRRVRHDGNRASARGQRETNKMDARPFSQSPLASSSLKTPFRMFSLCEIFDSPSNNLLFLTIFKIHFKIFKVDL